MKFYLAVLLLFLFSSCIDQPENYQYDILRRQLTPDRKHYIYDYSREGGFVTSNEISGRRLMGINESFGENTGKDVAGIIDHWSKDTVIIHIYRRDYEQPKDTFIIKTEYESYDGIVIKRIYEQPIVGGGIADEINFDAIKIENNRIKFYGAKSKFEDKKSSDPEISFSSGEVLVYSDSGSLTKIEIDKQYKSMNFSRIDESGKRLYNQPEVVINTYEFTPRKKINPNSLGEIGIFRDYKLPNQR
ncbi:MAG: hypothetical protein ACHQIM_15780 [Sphingobacteriales bacterium]